MVQEFDLKCIQGVCDGMLHYEDNGKPVKIDIKKSAALWWDTHHRRTVMDKLLRKRTRNKYAGDKCFTYTEAYIRMYVDGDEIIFRKKFPDEQDTSDGCEFRMWWSQINRDFNKQGYWLFDYG